MNGLASPAPSWLRIVAGLGLLWNLIGVYNYLGTVGVVGNAPAMTVMPAWVTGAFAIATFGGAIGCIGLLMLKSWSKLLLFLSAIAVLAMDVWTFGLRNNAGDMAGAEMGLTATVAVISLFLAWLGHHASKKGWLS